MAARLLPIAAAYLVLAVSGRPCLAGPRFAELMRRQMRAATEKAVATVPDLETPVAAADAPAQNPVRLTRDADRDAVVAALGDANFPQWLGDQGLVLWHIISDRNRGGQRLYLNVSLAPDGAAYTRQPSPERKLALSQKLDGLEARIISEASRILDLQPSAISVNGRLIENCCGMGCQSCLHTKPHAEGITGLPTRPLESR